MKYSYVRVSSGSQFVDRQAHAMGERGIPAENIYADRQSGKDANRPQLAALMAKVRSGDTVYVESISRFARNTRDLLELVEQLSSRGVEFVSLKECTDEATPTGKFMLTVFGAVAELERGYILDRQAEGIAAAKRRGVRFGRAAIQPPEGFAEAVGAWESGELSFGDALRRTGLKQATFYRRLAELRAARQSE